MKILCLARHAKAERSDASLPDVKRSLTERGYDDALRMGQRLKQRGYSPNLIITSPARRALSTAELMAKEIFYDEKNIGVDKTLYEAGVEEIEKIVRGAKARVNTLMLVGHNPGMHEYIEYLTGKTMKKFPTAGICAVKVPVDSWRAVGPASGTIVWLSAPQESM